MSVELVDLGSDNGASAAIEAQASEARAPRKHQLLRDGLVLLALLIGVCAIFAKTVFLGVPISKLARLTLWDSAFAEYRQGMGGLMDPSLIQLMIPYYCLVAKSWHAFQLPLWNPYNGCGVPLLADPQSLVFSPLHAVLAFVPSLRVYNLILVCQLWLGAAGTFLLGRAVGLNRCASVMAAVAFAFCPYLDWYMEIVGNGYMLVPMLFWLYVRTAQRPSIRRAALSGIFTAAVILSGHPETSFCCIVSGSMLMLALVLSGAYQSEKTEIIERFNVAISQLGITAVVAFCLCAPMLLPFIEYLKFSDSYKYTSGQPLGIPSLLFSLDLLQPTLGGASLYLGIVPLLCLPFCLAQQNKIQRSVALSLLAVALMAEAFTSQLWPVNCVVQATPLKSLIPNYCQPVPLLLLAVLSAFGLQYLMETNTSWKSRSGGALIAIAATTAAATCILQRSNISLAFLNFDSSLADAHLDWKEWQLIAGLTSLVVALLLTRSWWKQRIAYVPILICIALSFYSQFNQAKHALPAQAHFDYPMVAAVRALNHCPGRYVAVGDHLLKPDTNALYGISDFRFHNPIFPAQFTETMEVAGAQLDGFNQNFNPPLSAKLGLASVSRVLSLQPLWSQGALASLEMHAPATPCAWKGLQLNSLCYAYDQHNKQIVGKLNWQATVAALPQTQPVSAGHYEWHPGVSNCHWSYFIVLVDQSNATLWFSDGQPVPMKSDFQREFAIPLRAGQTGKLTVCLQLFNTEKARFVQPLGSTRVPSNRMVTLFEFTPQELTTSLPQIRDKTFSLIKELPPTLRLYENKAALPSAYVVQNTQPAHSPEEALAMMRSSNFDWTRTAVVESEDLQRQSTSRDQAEDLRSPQFTTAHVTRLSPVEVSIEASCKQPGLLVLTDTFYPGWKAEVDGQPTKIIRTNGMFRGLFLAGGNHSVRFTYVPLWFYVGMILAMICSTTLLFGETLKRFRQISPDRKAS